MGQWLPSRIAGVAAILCVVAGANSSPRAEETACPFAGQQPIVVVQLFFGQSIKGRGPVTPREWQGFLEQTVTPRLSDGFTVYDAYGQWMNPQTHSIGREKTKVIVAAAPDTPAVRARVGELTAFYRDRFQQKSVGIITTPGCAVF